MSSHHIVREKQEPALLILGLDHFTDELLGQLLEWSPTVLVTANTAEQLDTMGIKVDVIIEPDNAELQSDIKTISDNQGKPAQAALAYLIGNGYPAVNIVTDDFVSDHFLPFISRINIVVYHSGQKIYAVHSGFSKWKPAGETISIMGDAGNLQVRGLNKIADSEYITTADGFFSLHFEHAEVLIAERIL